MFGDAREVAFGHLDGVAEDAVVLDLQRRNPGSLALPLLEARQVAVALVGLRAYPVQLRGYAVTDIARVGLPSWRLRWRLHQGLFQPLLQLGEVLGERS